MINTISNENNEILMDTMRANIDSQERPKVGMFWYNPERNRLIGIRSAFAHDLSFNAKGRKTVSDLHAKVWDDVREDAVANGSADIIWQEEDYTQVPRGRVFQIQVPDSAAEYFEVLVGSWINDFPDAIQSIIKAFNLNEADYQFIRSEHWDIGRGTSEIYF